MKSNREPKIFRTTKLTIGVMALASMFFLSSCGDDDSGTTDLVTDDIVDLASATGDLSTLVTALSKFPDLVEDLTNDAGSYTVFAPTNGSFAALLEATGQTSLDDIPEPALRRVLEYHIIRGASLLSTDLSNGQLATTELGDQVEIGVDGVSVTVNGANVTAPNIQAVNGVVHIIDAILVPSLEASILNTVVEPAYFNVNFTVLTEAVVTAGLLNILIDTEEEYTVFAPTNDAFAAAGIETLEGLTADDLTPILLYHVLGSEVLAANLPETGSAVPTLGGNFYLSINSDGVFINGSTEVVDTDLEYDNGVVHVIDRALSPASSNVVEIAVAASQDTEAEFGQLVAALTAVQEDEEAPNLITTLSNPEGAFTIFAPTDEAFQELYELAGVSDFGGLLALEGVDLNVIATVLQYHVVDGRIFSTDIPNALGDNMSTTITPLAGGTWTLNGDFTISDTDSVLGLESVDAGFDNTDILATNGVIHVINQVILP